MIEETGGVVIASTYQALRAQENQPAGANPLGRALVVLTRQLQSLTASRLATEDGAMPQSSAAARPSVVSLVKRIRRLRALLLRLARTEPSYARRLAPELLTLRLLLHELSSTQLHVAATTDPAPASSLVDRAPDATPVAVTPAPALASPAVTRFVPVAAASPCVGESPVADVAMTHSDATTTHSGPTSAAPRPPRLQTTLPASSGLLRSVSASGAPGGSGAGTLATRCRVCLPMGLLSGRLTLIVLPWRLAVMGHRLERPG